MMRRVWSIALIAALLVGLCAPLYDARAQDGCGTAPPTRLTSGGRGMVTFTDGRPLNVRDVAGLGGAQIGQLPEGTSFSITGEAVCADNYYWWPVESSGLSGWIAEGDETQYFVEPAPAPVTPVTPGTPLTTGGPFTVWDWALFTGDGWGSLTPDPLVLTLPPAYAGDLPALPLDLSSVTFLEDAGLNDAQKALLAQNGFVVVPAGLQQFDDAYSEGETWLTVPPDYDWEADPATQGYGHAYFVTTDSTLHALHYIFDSLLTDLEKDAFYPAFRDEVLAPTLQAAHDQAQQAAGTPLEQPARDAELYLAVAATLFSPDGSIDDIVGPDVAEQARSIAAMALQAQGQLELPFLPGYNEDFSQYIPRGHYAGDADLEAYFRGMMWTGRITFLANDNTTTQMALLVLRALLSAPGAYDRWRQIHDTLTFLIGPIDDLGPLDYAPLAEQQFGAGLPLDALADPALVEAFRAQVNQLPPPRVNGMVLPLDTTAENVAERTRGFRLMGQRFTFDGYVMQQLMNPYVESRPLPLGLDVPATIGSDIAYGLAVDAGAADFARYDTQVGKLRGELGALTDDNWRENTYGAWLWALKPLWVRDVGPYPPLMQTDAWWRKDIHTGLASWTELKHDTVLYAKQPTGFGGGGPPLTSFGYVEPNPLVFARIAVVAAMTYQGLQERGFTGDFTNTMGYAPDMALRLQEPEALIATMNELRNLAVQSAGFAEIARKELAGEPLTEDEYWSILGFGDYLYVLLHTLYQGEGDPPPVALVTDVANNPDFQVVLQEGVGYVDFIYVVVPAPDGGTQLVRGGVFSYYEFVNDINQRMTDQEWRDKVAAGDLPPRPDWVGAFYSK